MFYNNGLEILLNGLMAAVIAQLLKLFGYLIKYRQFNFKVLTTTGGMPSSHSAGVIGMTTTAGIIDGFTSPIFAIALGFSLVVMYDAAGVRRAAGKQARLLNKIVQTPGLSGLEVQEKLVEVLGHTPIQVFVGALIGLAVGLIF